MALTKVTYSMIEGAATSVLDYGADPTGATSSVAAFNAALALGGTVYVPSGTYKLDSRVELLVDGTTLWLAADVTLNLSGVSATQSPFGNQIHVYANNCAVIGSGPSSLLQITNGSQANAVGVLHHHGLTVSNITIDGDKANGSAIADDTFMSGVSIVVTTAGGATEDVKAVVENCTIRNFLQYGINVYGDLASDIKIQNCTITDNGKAGDALSVGAGIVCTRANSRIFIANNTVNNNKFMGVFCSSAGEDGTDWTITGNICSGNGHNGIGFTENAIYFSTANVGLKNIAVTGNVCRDNGRSGIELSVDTVGFLKEFTITGNVCNDNTLNGIGLLCTNTAPQIVSDVIVLGNTCVNNGSDNQVAGDFCENIQGLLRPFTPFIRGSSSAGTATYSAQNGAYIRVGQTVTFELVLDWTGHTGTGSMEIAGFPYASDAGEPGSQFWAFADGLTITGQATFGLTGGQTYGPVYYVNNGTAAPLAMDAAAALRVSGAYITPA